MLSSSPHLRAAPAPLAPLSPRARVQEADGSYAGFDEAEFTCRSGGKPAAIRHIKVRAGAWPP